MTDKQFKWIGAISVVALVVVLIEGGQGPDDSWVKAAANRPATSVNAALPEAAGADQVDVAADDSGDSSGSGLDGDASGVVSADSSGDGSFSDSEITGEEGTETSTPASSTPTEGSETPSSEQALKPSKIKHVFVIALQGQGGEATFGASSSAPYLASQLRPKGTLLTDFSSLGGDLADLVGMVGGQPPNSSTQSGCEIYKEYAQSVAPSKQGVISSAGCAYPNTVTTVVDQLGASNLTWQSYIEDIERGPKGDIKCRRPDSDAQDDTFKGRPGDSYATRHNPFVYFHSLLDLGECDKANGSLKELDAKLTGKAPNFNWIAPNLCNAGTENPCADGSEGGLARADKFLANWVPKILASPSYKKDGLLIVTFAGGKVGENNGTLVVSPFAEAGAASSTKYNPYALLRTFEDLFGLKPLALAKDATGFADSVLGRAVDQPTD